MSSYASLVHLSVLYEQACQTFSDIHEHLPLLRLLAAGREHVTEMGTRGAVSTLAFLVARPKRLVCYDLDRSAAVDDLFLLAPPTEMVFHQANVLEVDIEDTDVLLIDTLHTFVQLSAELDRHASRVRSFIALHDTTTFGDAGEMPGHVGLWPAVKNFLEDRPEWSLAARLHNNNGLTVLERAGASS